MASARPMSPVNVVRTFGSPGPMSPTLTAIPTTLSSALVPAFGGAAGVGITFEPDMRYGSSTQGMQIITNIRPNSPADKTARIQKGDILAMVQANEGSNMAGLPISKVLSLLTGNAGTSVKLHILDGEFPYLPPKVVVCQREFMPTGISQTQVELGPSYGSGYLGSAVPMIAGSAAPMFTGSAMPMAMSSARPMSPMAVSPQPLYTVSQPPLVMH